MPLIFNKIFDHDNTQIAVWENNEHDDFYINALNVCDKDLEEIMSYREHRRKEWLCSRYIINLICESTTPLTILKDEYGKPFIKDSNLNISISHSNNRAAVIISDKLVGIDIQKQEEKIDRIFHKFISEEEQSKIETQHTKSSYHIFWGAKEAMYKGWGKKELDFKTHMHVYPFSCYQNNLELKGWVRKENIIQEYDLFTDILEDYYLVFAVLNKASQPDKN
ncbi:MAG: 4'-phosphopantetheinyl transferase superfamily protein [Saprospiraceae bacterium]|nr:4'-phosphopantetheinyl transferase superfamily protein [Bacteroidia bacterium]NNE15996.1 4'-phosphopantetheinyl transferase superfamily protein [Saprospiraceae bacterium]NNL93852.1 4'-phosphopantetheinyl transferase superfamily protein [Saprospiraceae bacterium]